MAEQRILNEIKERKRQDACLEWLSNQENSGSLPNSRTRWQVFVDWVLRDKTGSWIFAILGSFLLAIPPILVAVASFSKSSQTLAYDFFVAVKSRNFSKPLDKEAEEKVENVLNAMDKSMRAKGNEILRQLEQVVSSVDYSPSLVHQAWARIAGILEDAPDGFPFKTKFFDRERIPFGGIDTLYFVGEGAAGLLESTKVSERNVDYFIQFMQQIFDIKLEPQPKEESPGCLIERTPASFCCKIDSENLNKILEIEISKAKERAKTVYETWKIKQALNLEIRNLVGGDEEQLQIANQILEKLIIKKSPEGVWIGESIKNHIGITAYDSEAINRLKKEYKNSKQIEESEYQKFVKVFKDKFGSDSCDLNYKSRLVKSNGGVRNKKCIALTFNIDSILKNNKAVLTTESTSGLMSAISTSARSQAGASSSSASTAHPEQPKSEERSSPNPT